jgi:hypothetical protein
MTVTTDTTDTTVVPLAPPQDVHEQAKTLVEELRKRLHQAAYEGLLNDEFANGIATGLVSANVVLDPTRALILFARAIEDEAAERRTNPRQDWDNPMGQNNVPSSAEVVLRKHEDIAAAKLAEALVSGPWPLF